MKKLFENLFGVLGFLLVFYFAMIFLLAGSAQSQVFFWVLTIVICAGILTGAFFEVFQPADKKNIAVYFFLSTIAVLAFSLIMTSPRWNEIGVAGQFFIWTAVVGVPLGLGASESLNGKLYATGERDIAIGILTGTLGATAAFFILNSMYEMSALKLYIPLLDIQSYNPLGINLFPAEVDTTVALECTRGVAPCPPGQSVMGLQWILALAVQGTQSSVAALWDAILFAGFVYATTAAGRAMLGMRS